LLSGLELLIALVAVFVGATIMGTVSFGMALVVAPVLLLFLAPQSVVVIANGIIVVLLALVLWRVRQHLHVRPLAGMALGGLAAVPLGVLALRAADPTLLRLTIGAVILLLGLLILFNVQIPLARHRLAGPLFGFLASLSITSLSIGGPLAAIYVMAQQWPPPVMRAALAFFFLSTYILAFALYAVVGLVDRDTLANVGLLVPGLLAGFGLASVIVSRINERMFRYAALAVIITGSVVLLGRELLRL
jgi:uncharacterized protein